MSYLIELTGFRIHLERRLHTKSVAIKYARIFCFHTETRPAIGKRTATITEEMLKQVAELRDDAHRARDCIQQVSLNQAAKKVIELLTYQIADLDKVLTEYQPLRSMGRHSLIGSRPAGIALIRLPPFSTT